ncbi:hypothetical protein Q5P01_007587 [Channa striata]|uniref:Neugrin n=1 Tax=Channa striata TaxID=64152 RepID=A0AA88NCD1_CHASR|nr:hypothetical protein Q5P01_007587 [Channa striata]
MARPLQLLSHVSRLAALSASPSVSTRGCRFASRGASRAWRGQTHVDRDRTSRTAADRSDGMSDGESGLEDLGDVEDKLQAVFDEGRKQQRTVKYHILRRQMTAPGAPQRKLTWDAIEQIRYLKQNQPEEWTVENLAEGFSVTSDVIQRVLRSKFVPSPERKARQDAKVVARLSQQVLPSGAGTGPDRLKLPGNRTPTTLLSGNTESDLVPVADQTLMIQGEGSMAKSPVPVRVLPSQFAAGICEDVGAITSTRDNSATNRNSTEDNQEDEDSWDGRVLTEKELEQLIGVETPSPVVQVGNDFFDADGNFLYRI